MADMATSKAKREASLPSKNAKCGVGGETFHLLEIGVVKIIASARGLASFLFASLRLHGPAGGTGISVRCSISNGRTAAARSNIDVHGAYEGDVACGLLPTEW